VTIDGGRIPVTLVTGYLGSGKTTLLNRLLRDPAFSNSAVIVNELGDIGIDHLLISAARDRIVLLDAGCLCCAMADSLRETLVDLYHRRSLGSVPAFDRVLIETSGLADPVPILQTLLKDALIAPLFTFAAVICVVDALHAAAQLADSVEAREQVALADRIIITKLDLAKLDPTTLDLSESAATLSLRGQLSALNPDAEVQDVPVDSQPLAPLFATAASAVAGRWGRALHHAVHARHSSGIVSYSFQLDEAISWAGIAAWTAHLIARYGDDLLRCKALLRLDGRAGRVVVQGVRRLFEIRHDRSIEVGDLRSSIVFIGRELDRAALHSGLAWLQAPEGLQQASSRDFAPWLLPEHRAVAGSSDIYAARH
jgi:G3E family GTPase